MHIERLTSDHLEEAVEVLCDAFFDYPVMRYIIAATGADYSRRLKNLITFFTSARFLRQELVLGVRDRAALVAVANVKLPATLRLPVSPDGIKDPLANIRRRLWEDLGAAARQRYEAFGEATAQFVYPEPHFHLSMIGVRRRASGRGHGRRLLDHVHDLSHTDPASCGVSLTTEDPKNVPLYLRFGYQGVGHARITRELETWGFFRPDASKRFVEL